MEHINETANGLTKTFSQNQQISTPNIPTLSREQHSALFAVINKSRLLNGWLTRTAQELDPTIRVWSEMFAEYGIPIYAYDALYRRAFDVRQSKQQQGQNVPQMDATLLVSQWTGTFGLKAELRQKEIERGRSLPEVAESVCEQCFGTGFKTEKIDGYSTAVKCEH